MSSINVAEDLARLFPSKLDEVKKAFQSVTEGLTDKEKKWAIKAAFPEVAKMLGKDEMKAMDEMKTELRECEDLCVEELKRVMRNNPTARDPKYIDSILRIIGSTEKMISMVY